MEDPNPSTNSSPTTLLGFLEKAATIYGDCTSIIYNNTTSTWSETHRRCLQLASSLSYFGLRPGDVVSAVAPNIPAMYELQFAVPLAGAVLNNISTGIGDKDMSLILRDAKPQFLFVDCQSHDLVCKAIKWLPQDACRPNLIYIDDDSIEKPAFPEGFFHVYKEFVDLGDPNFRPEMEWDPMALNYTSGTTSFPALVVHSHRWCSVSTINSLNAWAVPKQPVYLWMLNRFHGNGWSFPWGMAAVGGTNVCVRDFNAKAVFDLIEDHGVTHMCCPTPVLNMLTKSPQGNLTLRKPVHVLTAGGSSPKMESLGFVVRHEYGLTETARVVFEEDLPNASIGKIQKKKKGSKKPKMTMTSEPERRSVFGRKIRTDVHGIMMQRRSYMNTKTFPKFALAPPKPSLSNFSVHYVNSVSSIPCMWL